MLNRRCWPVLPLALALLSACADDPALPSAPRAPGAVPAFTIGAGCKVKDSFDRGLTPGNGQINQELNDYGRVLADADDGSDMACVDSAASALHDKLKATLDAEPDHFRDFFLDGALVALIFSSADRIGANGGMTAPLDTVLQRVADGFGYPADADAQDSCGLQSTDNCMDGHSVAASGFGWVAAYRYRRGLPGVAAAQAAAVDQISQTFSSACIFSGYGRATLCNGTPDSLTAGTATTLSLNIGQQYPAYGFGLMTSVATAVLGLQASGTTYAFTQDQKAIAKALFAEAQRTIDATAAPDTFFRNCPKPVKQANGLWAASGATAFCGGEGGNYQPQMYALKAFYQAMGVDIPTAGTYTSDAFYGGHFRLTAARDSFFSWGRYETYGYLGDDWWRHPRSHMPTADNNAPRGYLDLISSTRYAQGWACDPDMPSAAVRVALYAPGQTPIVFRADLPNEAGVNTACGGGTGGHRFNVQLPASWAGLTVNQAVVDYLGLRWTIVGCGMAGGCRVPTPTPNASVSVAWVKPASASWGQPNTLTAAGYSANGTGGVQMLWRDASVNGAWSTVAWVPDPAADGSWSNTIPSSNYCHDYQVQANYSGAASATFTYHGLTSGYCPEAARVIWIQPQTTAGFGPAGSLVVAGQATGAPAGTGVTMWWRNVTTGGGWTQAPYVAPTDANGIWYNSIPDASYGQQYAVAVVYDVFNSQVCTYAGANAITWC